MFKFIIVAIIALILVMAICDVSAIAAFFIILGVFIVGCIVLMIYAKFAGNKEDKLNKEFNKKTDSIISYQNEKYNQYKSKFNETKSSVLGYHPRFCKIDDEITAYKTSNNKFKICVCIEPKRCVVNNKTRTITEAKPGEFRCTSTKDINNILFWKEVGDVQYTSTVSGGGVNLGGAIAGAMIAGEVGAAIGSRQAITTETQTHDSRQILLKMTNGKEEMFPYKYRKAFSNLIPEKEYTYINMMNQK